MKTVVIGVGNEYRHDDGAGFAAVARLRALEPPGVVLAESDGEPTSLLDLWFGADLAIVIDGVRADGPPGRIFRLGLHHPSAVRPGAANTHGGSLGDAVALARALDRMPRRLLLFGIQVADVSPGLGLSAPVARAVDAVVDEIVALLDHHPSGAR